MNKQFDVFLAERENVKSASFLFQPDCSDSSRLVSNGRSGEVGKCESYNPGGILNSLKETERRTGVTYVVQCLRGGINCGERG